MTIPTPKYVWVYTTCAGSFLCIRKLARSVETSQLRESVTSVSLLLFDTLPVDLTTKAAEVRSADAAATTSERAKWRLRVWFWCRAAVITRRPICIYECSVRICDLYLASSYNIINNIEVMSRHISSSCVILCSHACVLLSPRLHNDTSVFSTCTWNTSMLVSNYVLTHIIVHNLIYYTFICIMLHLENFSRNI